MTLTIDDAVYSYFSAVAGVTAVIGDRIYPTTLPLGATLPAIVYHQISGPREYPLGSSAGPVHARIQFDAYGTTAKAAKQAVDAIEAALSGFAGSYSGLTVHGAWVDNELTNYDAVPLVYHRLLDVTVLYE